jgi:signal transduction histidine kinase
MKPNPVRATLPTPESVARPETADADMRLIQAARLAAVGQLVESIAHQLRTPLASIALRAESLARATGAADGTEQDRLRRHPQAILDETDRCSLLLAIVERFARPGEDVTRRVDLNAVCRDALALVQHEALRRQVTLEARLADDLPGVWGREDLLAQAASALILNALEASPRGGRVTVVTRASSGGPATLHVMDEGPGVPPSLRSRLFEPFGAGASCPEKPGLGLSACRRIAALHGGTVELESAPGRGCCFSLRLPPGAPGHEPKGGPS